MTAVENDKGNDTALKVPHIEKIQTGSIAQIEFHTQLPS